jgi:hypothetical protein
MTRAAFAIGLKSRERSRHETKSRHAVKHDGSLLRLIDQL